MANELVLIELPGGPFRLTITTEADGHRWFTAAEMVAGLGGPAWADVADAPSWHQLVHELLGQFLRGGGGDAMTDRTARFAMVTACIVAPLAVIGSAFSLYRIAVGAGLALPVALPVALDFTALAAAAQIRARRHLALAWVTLVAGVLGSAALQVADAWAAGPIAWGVHGALPLAALVCFEFTVPDRATTRAAAKPRPKPVAPTPAKNPASPARPPEVKPTPLRPPRPDARPLRPAAGLDELVALAENIASVKGKAPADLSRSELQEGVKAHPSRGGRGIGTKRAGEVLDHFRQPPARELEVVR